MRVTSPGTGLGSAVAGFGMLEGTLGAGRDDTPAPGSYNLCLCLGPVESGYDTFAATPDEA